ncbi:MAG: hypothetical protein KAG97_11100, partial [Victivallales bacterium]|nr:hypothetical protein [Victivallales bacterium]
MKNAEKDFKREDALKMFDEMVAWLAAHQVLDRDDPNEGAIYFPSEDRFCNRDTACMARAFLRQYVLTGDESWRGKAASARDFVLRAQKEIGGFPEMRGREESDEASTVNTSIVASNLIKAYELGLDCDARDLNALEGMANFVMTMEWKPGAFYHDTNHSRAFGDRWGDEGSRLDCQNTTALAAMMLKSVYYFLKRKQYGGIKNEWIHGAERAVTHLLEGQAPNGQWPYFFDAEWNDAGHHSMCMFYLIESVFHNPSEKDDMQRVLKALRQGARWTIDKALLQTKLGTKINWATHKSASLYFSAEYFLIAAPLARMA